MTLSAKMPWPVGVIAAIASFLALHVLAAHYPAAAGPVSNVADLGSVARLEQTQLLDAFLSRTRLVEVYYRWRPNLPDEGDNHVLELAVAAGDAPVCGFY